MTPKKNLYYALGELAYAVAMADGIIQFEERKKFMEIVQNELKLDHQESSIATIIFDVLGKDQLDWEIVYQWALKEMNLYQDYLTDDMKIDFVAIIEKIAHAFSHVTDNEQMIINRFRKDIESLGPKTINMNE